MRPFEVAYGDVHWHTHFSDNKDHASVEAMVREAARFGLTILGTGDHNHNLTAASWEQEKAETDALRRVLTREHTRLVILNNCEMTFMFGHFLVFEPPHVDGTAREAYGYLYELGLRSELRVAAVSPGQYAFPESWRQVIGPDDRHFACQFFTE